MVPTIEKCIEIMEKYQMLDNIKAHSFVVEKVAGKIAMANIEAGSTISLKKVVAGSLMHDIGKTPCLNTKINHALKGKEICMHNDFMEIAEIVEEHVKLKTFDPEGPIRVREIVYYADKRVNHDKIVSLDKRLEYLLERYAGDNEKISRLIKENFDECREVEKKLFADLSFGPDKLTDMIK